MATRHKMWGNIKTKEREGEAIHSIIFSGFSERARERQRDSLMHSFLCVRALGKRGGAVYYSSYMEYACSGKDSEIGGRWKLYRVKLFSLGPFSQATRILHFLRKLAYIFQSA